ncbi:phage tail protein [Achromobacter sp. K91]|uniref:phage tail protein n=1 Tax=Achromobacter sp. K91 TaxID=2292262 RepID=UPI000E65ED3C|nr:phage tail protein [Achromobacter sp. K91]RIJ00775.1 phage tail protein [Achromobacter sp. K91]
MQKEVFQTDADGLYLYKTVANELALTPGAYNVPYGAYEEAPPIPPAGKWPRRVGDSWEMVDDYRATPLWIVDTGSPYMIGTETETAEGKVTYGGWGELPAWLTAVEPPQSVEDFTPQP